MNLINIAVSYFKKIEWTKVSRMVIIALGLMSIIFNLTSGLYQYPKIQNDVINLYHKKNYCDNALTYLVNYFSNYIVQTAIIVIIWFSISLILDGKETEYKILQSPFVIALCIYTTITMITYFLIILPTIDFSELERWFNEASENLDKKNWIYFLGTLKSEYWITKLIQAVFLPLSLNIYFIFFMKNKINFNSKEKSIFKTKFFLYFWIYPIIYSLFSITWCEIKYQLNLPTPFIYFFFDFRNYYYGAYGYIWFILISIIIILLFISMMKIYIHINNENIAKSKSKNKKIKSKRINKK